jgi:hypothetical protein
MQRVEMAMKRPSIPFVACGGSTLSLCART